MKTSHTIALSLASITLTVSAAAFARPTAVASSATVAATGCINFCTAGTTTNGCLATMSCVGTPSVSQSSGFVLTAQNVEGMKNGLIRYSLMPHPTMPPWGVGGTSFLCIKAPMQQTGIQNSGGTVNQCNGALSLDFLVWASAHPAALGQPFTAGTSIYVQALFQDPPAVKTTNLSDGLMFTLVP
jgi:hypothetical protein